MWEFPCATRGAPHWQGLRWTGFETDGSNAAVADRICERDRYRMAETAGISLAGSVRAIARVEPGPTAVSGRVRPRIRKRALRDEVTERES